MSFILPTPKKITEDSSVILLPARANCACDAFAHLLTGFTDCAARITDLRLENAPGGITFVCDESIAPAAYSITSNAEGVRAAASDAEGIGYAMATLLLMITASDGMISVPAATVEDAPDKGYRALMVDLGREWHPMDCLFAYVDLCFLYKIRYLHLHLCDSKLFTQPSAAFPRLNRPGYFYTPEQIAALRAHAAARGVVLIPEFECPGHAHVLCRTYPEIFSDRGEDGTPQLKSDIICAASDAAWESTKILLRELMELFPDAPYIHIGGDEANLRHWEKCPHCAAYMAEHGLEDVHELYSEYVARVTDFVLSEGRIPMVWEGFPKKGAEKISRDVIVFAWESMYHMAYDLLDEGFTIINASWQPLYVVPSNYNFRWGAKEILGWNVYNWQNWNPKSEAHLNPITVPATDRVIGGMLCAWEQTYEEEIGTVMENLLAMCERTWSTVRRLEDGEYIKIFSKVKKVAAKLIARR